MAAHIQSSVSVRDDTTSGRGERVSRRRSRLLRRGPPRERREPCAVLAV